MMRRLWAGFWLAVLLAGTPVVLVATVGNPVPSREQWLALVDQPLTEDTIYAAIAVVAWLIWAGIFYAAIARAVLRLRRAVRWLRRLPRLPLPTPMQGLAGGMLGAVAVTGQASTASLAPPAAATATVSTLDSIATLTYDTHEQAAATAGVDLPDGGWLPAPVAHAVQAAAAVVWWRRRQQYQPASERGTEDVRLLPAAAVAVQAALLDTSATAGQQAPVVVPDLPEHGTGLTGFGAVAAARGILAALLLTHHTDDPRVVITASDLQSILGPAADACDDVPGLNVVGDLSDALSTLEQIVLEHAGRPTTLLATVPDDPVLARRLAVLLTLGAHHGLSGVLLGAWHHGTSWHVAPDGNATTGPTPAPVGRLCVLTDTTAADLLAVAALRTRETPASASTSSPTPAAAPEPAANAPIRLALLGGVTVTAHGKPVSIRRSAATQIMAFLALHPEGATSGQLSKAIWPHRRPHAAAGSFYTTISELRAILRTAADGREVIIRNGERYLLDPAVVDVDVHHLQAAAHQAEAVATAAVRDTARHNVISQYRGELAAGNDWPWVAPLREAVHRLVVDAYLSLAEDHPRDAAALLRAATRIDPVNEYLHRQAVRALTAAGEHRTVAALRDKHVSGLALANPNNGPDQHV